MLISKRSMIIVHDLLMAAFAWQVAWWARFNFEFPFEGWQLSLYLTPAVVLIQGAIYLVFRLYRGRWRFASIPDLLNIVRAAIIGTLCISLLFFIAFRLEGVPRSILVLYPLLLIFCLGGPRLTYRFMKERKFALDPVAVTTRVLIIGAGRAAEMLVREMLRDGKYFPVGILDDRPELQNSEIHGVRVIGSIGSVADTCRQFNPDIITIAIPSATGEQMRRIVELCEETGVPMRTLPGLSEMVVGGVVLKDLREVSIEDLLGREKVEMDMDAIRSGLGGRTVLVSGAGGSIGSELCRQIMRLRPRRLVMLDRSEFNLYRVQQALAQQGAGDEVPAAVLGDVCDRAAMDQLFGRYRPEVIFHAAAYKHVPILEEHCREAVLNNIFGTLTLAQVAERNACRKFVLISTDKAVSPVSVLGASKRVAELLCESRNNPDGTHFITVRFGNVLGSDGSAIPMFQEQIRSGGPVTVTHPDVTRYFMTISEACELILQAGAMGRGGEVFVLDMGTPVRITYLAEQMIRLAGLVPGSGIRIEYIGLRRGEKLHEELFYPFERPETTAHRKIFHARHSDIDRQGLEQGIVALRDACERYDEDAIRQLMYRLAGTA